MPIKENSQNPLEAILSGASANGRKHPVPQNVMDVEFKVVGDLTLRQLAYLFMGGILGYAFFKIGLPSFWSWTLMIFSIILGAAIAFVPFEERGLDKWLVLFIHAMFNQQPQMKWKKSSNTPIYFLTDYASIIKNEIITLTPVKSRNKLEEYLGMLPEEHDMQDLYNKDKMDGISANFLYNSPSSVKLATNIEPKVQIEERVVPIGDPISLNRPISVSRPFKNKNVNMSAAPRPIIQTPQIAEPKVEIKQPSAAQPQIITKPAPIINPDKEPEQKEIVNPKQPNPEVQTIAPVVQPEPIKQESITIEETPIDPQLKEIAEEEMESKNEVLQAYITQKAEVLPNAQIDRPIKNWPSSMQDQLKGEIKLTHTQKLPPIIVAQDIKHIKEKEDSLEKKVQELLEVAARAREEFEAKGLRLETNPKLDFYKNKYLELQKEKENLTTELSKNTSRVEMLEGQKQQKPLEKQVIDLTERNQELEQKLQMIQNQLFELKNTTPTSKEEPTKQAEQQAEQKPQPQSQPVAKTIFNSGQNININYGPNILAGLIKDSQDNLLENTVVLIKDSHGNVVRALKTNKLGQFKTQSPLINGDYIIEAVKAGETFDIIRLSAVGKEIPVVEIVSKGKSNE